jgi:hypothetical protein
MAALAVSIVVIGTLVVQHFRAAACEAFLRLRAVRA